MLKSTKCKICRKPSIPFKQFCSPECGAELGLRLIEKSKRAEAKNVRKADKERKEKLKTRADWMREAQSAFNAYIRARDAEQPCICCRRKQTKVNGLGAHGWDAGHFLSVGSAPHLRFHEDNVHKQLVYCNRYGSGNAVNYRKGLIKRIGIERVEALERDNTPRKYTIEDLKSIKELYKFKLKELQK